MGFSGCKIDAPRATFTLVVGACTLATAYIYFRKSRNSRQEKSLPVDHSVIHLSQQDLVAAQFPPVATLTFFSGSTSCEAHIKSAWQSIVKQNPWLAGYLVLDDLMIVHPTSATTEQANSMIQSCPDTITACLDPSNPDANAFLSETLTIPFGAKTKKMAKSQLPLARVVIVPCKNDTATPRRADFAIFFCTSHVLGGADTHYKLLNMLSCSVKPYKMPVTRLQGFFESTCLAIGHGQDWFMKFGPFMGRMLLSLFLGGAHRAAAFIVDSEAVQKRKANLQSPPGASPVPYISTNDVICSSFANMIKARILIINVNFRNKIPGVVKEQAGNYEVSVPFDREHFQSPEVCRLALNALVRRAGMVKPVRDEGGGLSQADVKSKDMMRESNEKVFSVSLSDGFPGWWGFWRNRYCLVTNWSSFHEGNMQLPGATEVYSVPAGPISLMHSRKQVMFDTAIIFRARKSELGVLLFSRSFSKDEYVRGMPVKDATV